MDEVAAGLSGAATAEVLMAVRRVGPAAAAVHLCACACAYNAAAQARLASDLAGSRWHKFQSRSPAALAAESAAQFESFAEWQKQACTESY